MSACLSIAAARDRKIQLPIRPAAVGPVQRLTELDRVGIGLRQESLQRFSLAGIYLLHHHGQISREGCIPDDPCLQLMMCGIVMVLAKKDELRFAHRLQETGRAYECLIPG
jgi:hypothetical protein